MSAFDTAMLRAYLRGELDAASMDAIEAAMASDDALVAQLEALADTDAAADPLVAEAFAPIETLAVPERLTAAVRDTRAAPGQLIDFAAVRAARRAPRWGWPQLGAMAASVAVGVLGSQMFLAPASNGSALVVAAADGPRLAPPLAAALGRTASGAATDVGALGKAEVMISFRNGAGELCRQFSVTGAGSVTDALSCRDASGWRVEAVAPRPAPVGEIRTASGDAAPAVIAAVDAIIAGDLLVGADEAAALKGE
jgi:anti-sigma factor RsiW